MKQPMTIDTFSQFLFPSNPRFSPDGTQIAFLVQRVSLEANAYLGISISMTVLLLPIGSLHIEETSPIFSGPKGDASCSLSRRTKMLLRLHFIC